MVARRFNNYIPGCVRTSCRKLSRARHAAAVDACYDRGAPLFFSNTTPHFEILRTFPKNLLVEKNKPALSRMKQSPDGIGTQT